MDNIAWVLQLLEEYDYVKQVKIECVVSI